MPDYRMKWIRIWPHAWFDSSMRVELTNAERAFWVDVIALAGKSRIPGVICSDREGTVGYPLPMLSSLLVSWTPDEVTSILGKLEKTQRVQVTRSTLMSGEDGWIVRITNWHKYQSEAQRVSKYKSRVYPSTLARCKNDRIEVEEEVEVEVEKKDYMRTANTVLELAFGRFWAVYPRKNAKRPAEKAFKNLDLQNGELENIISAVERWKETDQWKEANGKFIPYPATFINQRRWEDEITKASLSDDDTSHLER